MTNDLASRAPAAAGRPDARRLACRLLVVALVAVAACSSTTAPVAQTLRPLAALADSNVLKEPVVVRSVPKVVGQATIGLLDVSMEVTMLDLPVPGAGTEQLRTYRLLSANGVSYQDSNAVGFPGPTFSVQPGDSIRILLSNNLPAESGHGSHDSHACMDYKASQSGEDTYPNCFHGPNTTNLHYHGFHVTPQGTGDNVLLEIAPGETFQFAFRIPYNQSSGTHWYHPHKHGSVALQVLNGMAGAFVIGGGGLDSLTRADGIRERTLVIQEINTQLNLVRGQPGPRAKLINGQISPTIVMRPGEVQRWRIVNANVQLTSNYTLLFQDDFGKEEPALFAIARDGVQFAPSNYDLVPDTNLIVAPGNRLDVLVKAPTEPGLHELEAVLAGRVGAEVLRRILQRGQLGATGTPPLLRVRVEDDGTQPPTELPATLPPLPAFLANLTPTTTDTAAFVVFSETGVPGNAATPPNYFLGRRDSVQMKFNMTTPFLTMPLDSTQTWKVINLSPNLINHPFHIHINPFQVVEVVAPLGANDQNYPFYVQLNEAARRGDPIWLDTIALPVPDTTNGVPGSIVIRQHYADFTGRFVMHCHILGHEERGMMQLLEVAAAAKPQ